LYDEDGKYIVGSFGWLFSLGVSISCIGVAGIMSGLTIGLAAIDHLNLEIQAAQDPKVAKSAKTIFAVIKKHHWMLVTLLLVNAMALETLPIFLNKTVSDHVAIMISCVGILFVGEIIPMSFCTGPNQIKIAELMCPIVLGLMYGTFPITWPIGKGLDMWMGEHKVRRFNNTELATLLKIHAKEELDGIHDKPDGVTGLDIDALNLLTTTINSSKTPIVEIVTPLNKVMRLFLDTKLTEETMVFIYELGFSRIPVALSKEHPLIIGILLTKSLLLVERNGDTLLELLKQNKISIKAPIYIDS
jgi:metal transporter CNNM